MQVDLLHYGFNPFQEAQRLNRLSPKERIIEFQQQLESYANHVSGDQAVSIPYSYWTNHSGKLFSDPSRKEIYNIKNQVDTHERNGLVLPGIEQAAFLAQQNQGHVVILYSPTGKKLFDNTPVDNIDTKTKEFMMKPYDLGQLYFLISNGEKIVNIAISINTDTNKWLEELSPSLYEFNKIENEERRITAFLSSPQLLEQVDDFFNRQWNDAYHIYTNAQGETFSLSQVLSNLRKGLAGKTLPNVQLYDKTMHALEQSIVTAEMITQGYLQVLNQEMHSKGLSQMPLGGGCGGSSVTLEDIMAKLGLSTDHLVSNSIPTPQQLVSLISTVFRNIRQNSEKTWSYHEGACVICKKDPTKVGPCNICTACEKQFN